MMSQALAHIYLYGSVLGSFVSSRSGENEDFGSVSRIDNARRSPSFLVISRCSLPSLADQVQLAHVAESSVP